MRQFVVNAHIKAAIRDTMSLAYAPQGDWHSAAKSTRIVVASTTAQEKPKTAAPTRRASSICQQPASVAFANAVDSLSEAMKNANIIMATAKA